MSQDKQKLMQILNNLEKDYEEGLISEEKFIYLSNQYKHKIETIDVSNRIRAMQGRKGSDESSRYVRNPTLFQNLKRKRKKAVHGTVF